MPAPRISPRMKKVSIGRVMTRLRRGSSGSSMLVTCPGAPGGGRASGSRAMLSVLATTSPGEVPPEGVPPRTIAITQDGTKRFAGAVVTARLDRHAIVCPGSRRSLAIGYTYPPGAAPRPATAFQGGQAHRRAAAAPRATVLHLGVGSSGSPTGPAVSVPPRRVERPRVQPRPPSPHPPGAGVGRSALLAG